MASRGSRSSWPTGARINEIRRKPALTVTELASARQHQKPGRLTEGAVERGGG